jgi:hypothetical protein
MNTSVVGTVSLTGGSGTFGTWRWTEGNTVYYAQYWAEYGTTYTVNISGFRCRDNVYMAADNSHSFTTMAADAKTVAVLTQYSYFTAGIEGNVGFTVETTNIDAGEYVASVANLPTGMSVSGNVTIDEGGYGELRLSGDGTQVEGTTSTLTLTIAEITSKPFTLTISPPPTAPEAPGDFRVDAHYSGSATLYWKTPHNGYSDISLYQISYGPTASYAENWENFSGSWYGSTSGSIYGLDNGTDYTFEIRAVNAIGTGSKFRHADRDSSANDARQTGKLHSCRRRRRGTSLVDNTLQRR